jgi:hypothetical protein
MEISTFPSGLMLQAFFIQKTLLAWTEEMFFPFISLVEASFT